MSIKDSPGRGTAKAGIGAVICVVANSGRTLLPEGDDNIDVDDLAWREVEDKNASLLILEIT